MVPWLVHSDWDQPRRCPGCWSVAAVYASGRPMRRWRVYTCPKCGQRFARRPFLPWYPGEEVALRERAVFAAWRVTQEARLIKEKIRDMLLLRMR
jgi:hypothetical protein